MELPVTVDLRVGRNVPLLDTFVLEGFNLAGAGLHMQVRLYPDAPGDPLIDLTNQDAGVQGLSLSVSVPLLVPISRIVAQVDTGAIQNLPAASEPGDDATFYYDLITTGVNYSRMIFFRGKFIVEGSVTRSA